MGSEKKKVKMTPKFLARIKLLIIKLGKLLGDVGQISSSVLDTLSLGSVSDIQVKMLGEWSRL